ncbi:MULTISPECIES: glycosyltransferase family 4 protein [Spirulina sp. CCY15215]|uniref:glycosyltransferase family 4 protein n=1 Tax=Spirulina sp. CCY15215 TaxID=2767591 RepID=UPI0019514579
MSTSSKKIKITCVISSLAGGGAERAMVNLATSLCDRGYEITLFTLYPQIPDIYTIPQKIKRVYPSPTPDGWQRWFDLKGQVKRAKRIWKRTFLLRTDIVNTKPDLIISFIDITNVLIIRTLVGTKIPIIATERSDFRYHKIPTHWVIMRLIFYPLAIKIIVQTEELKNWVKKRFYPWNITVIPNPVFLIDCSSGSLKPEFFRTGNNIVAVGRLAPVKGFNLLIDAFATIASEFPNWYLTILGEGECRRELEAQIQKLNLEKKVNLPGRIPEPTKILGYADLFVLTSQYEGFPNALLEAMSCGLAPISFDCPSGPRAIIRNGIDGILVPPNNVAQLSQAMAELMRNDEKRKQLAMKAKEVLDRFSQDKVMDIWEQVIAEALKIS